MIYLWLAICLLTHFQDTQYNIKTRQILILPMNEIRGEGWEKQIIRYEKERKINPPSVSEGYFIPFYYDLCLNYFS